MTRIDRLFNILLVLQRRKLVRAAELAEMFAVSKRTIYRDMDALGEMGVPLAAAPGEGYMLVEGFTMPPLTFSGDEAKALVLGARMLAAQSTGALAQAAELAVEKIAHILPAATRRDVEQLVDLIAFYQPEEGFDLDTPYLAELQYAITEHVPVEIDYYSRKDEVTRRVIEPSELLYNEGAWYVTAFCRLRRDERNFRLDRIERLDVLDDRFRPRMVFPAPRRYTEVRVRVAANAVRWVRERQHYGYTGDEALLEDGDVVMRYRVESTDEIRAWLLGWGAQAVVLSPDDLRQSIRDEAQRLISLLT